MNKICCLFLSVIALSAAAEKPKSPAELATVPKEFVCGDGTTFLYRWMEPAKTEPGKKYPLVILMHGSGERGTNNVEQLNWGATPIVNWAKARKQELYMIVGQCPANDMWTALRTVAGSQPMTPKATQTPTSKAFLLMEKAPSREMIRMTG